MEDLSGPKITIGESNTSPTSTMPRSETDLRVQLSSFVGRVGELAELQRRFDRSRLVTLTGPGGSGKTRLALEVADTVRHRLPDGVFFVDLAPTLDSRLVPSAIASSLGIWEQPGRPVLDTLVAGIGDKRILVVLDNLEQLRDASIQISELLARCPNLSILATSRSSLHIRGEFEYPVDPLSLPTPEDELSLDRLQQTEAVALFIDRAQAISPRFVLTAENAGAIAGICRRLDGLPQAIELAAATMKLLGPQALLARLGQHLPFPGAGASDAPARQRTLHHMIGWSYDLLSEHEQQIFARLSVFLGGCTLSAADAVLTDSTDPAPASELLQDLGHLVEQSVLQVSIESNGEPRFSMLETIRDFALERLEARPDKALIERRHAEAYVAVAERAAQELLGDHQRVWLDRLDREDGNLRSALHWTIENGAIGSATRLGAALWRFWQLRGHLTEGRAWLDRILALPGLAELGQDRATSLEAAGGLAYWQGDLATAEVLYAESLTLRRELGDRAAIATALYNLSFVYFLPKTDLPQARSLLEESLATFRALGDEAGVGRAYWALSTVIYAESGRSDQAGIEEAVRYNEQSQAIFRGLGDQFSLGWALHWRGLMAITLADLGTARVTLGEALKLFAGAGDVSGITILLDDFSSLAVAEGALTRAACLSGAAAALQRSSGTDLASFLARLYSRARAEDAQLAGESVAKAWMEGEALSAEAAVALALSGASDTRTGGTGVLAARGEGRLRRGRHDLTPREQQVLELLAAGRSDGEISEALFISKKTASTHVANIKDKLGADSRVQMALLAGRLLVADHESAKVR